MDNIFDVVNLKLFQPLSARDKKANYELLMFLYGLFCEGEARPFIAKEEVVSAMANYIKGHVFEEILDDDDENIAAKSAREKATLKIKQFKRCGYLIEDTTDGFETNLSLEGNAILLLERMGEIAHKGKGQMEYTGYVYAVFTLCGRLDSNRPEGIDYGHSYELLQQIEERTRTLMHGLQGLNSKIRRYIEALMADPDLTPKQIYQIVLVEYQHDVLFTLFNNIKSKDNPDRYSDYILNIMKDLADSAIPDICKNMMDATCDEDTSTEHIQELQDKILNMITYVIQSFTWVQGLLEYIDKNNNRYLNTAKGKLNYILNEDVTSVEGQINEALNALKLVDEEFEFSALIPIRRSSNIDEKSTYTPRFQKDKITYVALNEPELTEEELELGRAAIFAEDRFSRQKVDQKALEWLGERENVALSEIKLETFDDLLFAFLMQIYVESAGLHYEVEPSSEIINVLGYRLHDFTLYRKES